MSEHFVEKCRRCGTTVSQCRCFSPDKSVRWVDSCCKCNGPESSGQVRENTRDTIESLRAALEAEKAKVEAGLKREAKFKQIATELHQMFYRKVHPGQPCREAGFMYEETFQELTKALSDPTSDKWLADHDEAKDREVAGLKTERDNFRKRSEQNAITADQWKVEHDKMEKWANRLGEDLGVAAMERDSLKDDLKKMDDRRAKCVDLALENKARFEKADAELAEARKRIADIEEHAHMEIADRDKRIEEEAVDPAMLQEIGKLKAERDSALRELAEMKAKGKS
ncbi:MAG: hypothetical protein WC822_02400 [Candidatus Paceibacterota bacterium]|jgi:hypothetical protein